MVAAAGAERCTSAARWLLDSGVSRLSEDGAGNWDQIRWLGNVLLRVVERGHGTDFPGGKLASAHARMLISLGGHYVGPWSAKDSYQQAAREYLSRTVPVLAALAQLGAAAAAVAASLPRRTDDGEVRAQLTAVGSIAPAAAAEMGPTLDRYLQTLADIDGVRAGTAEADPQGVPPAAAAEAAALFKTAAAASLADVATACRLARAADAIDAGHGGRRSALEGIGRILALEGRFSDAVGVLEECHNRHPQDRGTSLALAKVYQDLLRYDDARDTAAATLTEPPGPEDADALLFLQNIAYMQGDPQYQHWQALLAQIDPTKTLAAQSPIPPARVAPEQPVRVAVQDRNIVISEDLFELPEKERTAQLTAAIIASLPDGMKQLTELFDSDPELAERVAQLLGVRRVTPKQMQIDSLVSAGEEHFRHGRFEEAAAEYQAALDIDHDNAEAWLFLGDTWFRRGKHELAQAYFEESLAIMPTPPAFRFLGDAILSSGGSRYRARLCYIEALRLAPSYSGARESLEQLDRMMERSADWLTGQEPQRGDREAGAGATPPTPPTSADPAGPPDQSPAPSGSPPQASATVAPGQTGSVVSALRWSAFWGPLETAGNAGGPKSADGPQSLGQPPLPVGQPARLTPVQPTDTAPAPSTDTAPAVAPNAAEGRGDRLVQAITQRKGIGELVAAADADGDDVLQQWLARAAPDAIAAAIGAFISIAFQYEAKDRNMPRWEHWVRRQMQFAKALPADFGPGQAAMGIGRDRLLGEAYEAEASVLNVKGRLAEARERYERALELLNAEQEARVRAGLLGETEYDRVFSSTEPRAVLLENLARICKELGDVEAARRYATQGRQLNAARPTSEAVTERFIGAGNAALAAGDFESALGSFHRGLDRAEETAATQIVPRILATALNALGRCHHRLHLVRSALAYFGRACQLNESTGNAVRLTWDYREIGRVYRDRPDLGDARSALERSLICASRLGGPTDELAWTASNGVRYQVAALDRAWETLLDLGALLESRDEADDAAAFFGLATRIADVIRASAVDDLQRVAIANQRIEAFAALTRLGLRRAIAGGPAAPAAAEDAWQASESMRAKSFLDALGDDDLTVPAGIPAGLVEQEAAALERRRQLGASSTQDAAFWDELRKVQGELDSAWDGMVAASPAAEQYVEVRRSTPARAVDVQKLIAADGRPTVVASVTAFGPDKLAVLAIRSDSPHLLISSQPADLGRLARFVSQNLGAADRVRELATDLEDLFQHEMQPLAQALGEVSGKDDVLVLCPFGPLNYVPLAAVRIGDTQLVERNPLAVLPTASLARALRAAAGTLPRVAAMVFGDPTGDLPGARTEADVVGRLLGAPPVLGTGSTREAVSEALISAGTVHIAAHANFDVEDPLLSGIRLSDGVLSARELIMMPALALSLVTLSACETGINQNNPAQELLGLTRALLFAGADSLVVSLWKVPDAASLEIMSAFYRRLKEHDWKADALQAAALAAREQYGPQRFDQWAGFELIGEWR